VLGYLGGRVQPLLERMAAFPAPTFAVAHGACLGVGLGLLIASDIVYVADTAKIGSPFANLGATLDSGGHALFVERLGAHRTMDLIVTGRLMSGTEAVASGLFSQVFPTDEVTDAARAAARAAASGATQAFVASKALVASLRDQRLGLWQSMDEENRAQAALCDTDDYREGFAAFQQKRRPEFTGRG
jgi:2-(1,2-epoxy-1,2-dihydrophenyl)acetyl-CoA isomerase